VDPAAVRPALERALEVARQGVAATPSVAAPKELVRYLDFQKLTGPALAAVQRVLDGDDDFRRRVLASTTPEEIGAAGWLALSRPAGWEELLRAVAEADAEVSGSDAAARQVRDLQRALEASEHRRAEAQEAGVLQRKESEAVREELASVRKERRRGEDALAIAERRVDDLEQKLDDRETRLAEAQGAREAREHELAETQRLLADAHTELEGRPAPLVPGERSVDVAGLRDAASRLQRAATTLARSVDSVLAEVPPEPVLMDRGVDAAPLRSTLPLPGGVVADTADGARWLLARPEVVFLVDGYNVAKMAWPDAVLEQQRDRLIRALDELVVRTGATAEIVFDGPEDTVPGVRQGTRSVGVRYSGGALADDVVVDLVDAYPIDRPVVVVSNDREVRDAARGKAATVIGSDTLIAVFTG
jgi:predicted RNA-binding protein with PIN domain